MNVIMLMGIQATGKTTFYLDRLFRTHLRLSRSIVRGRVKELRLFEACLGLAQPVVLDDMNVVRSGRARYLALAREHEVPVVGYFFESKLAPVLRRNAHRRAPTPEVAVRVAFERLEPPAWAEGFRELWHVRLSAGEQRFEISPWQDEPHRPARAGSLG